MGSEMCIRDRAYAHLREAQAAARAGQRDQAARAVAAGEGLAHKLPSDPLLSLAEEVARKAGLATATGQRAHPSHL